MNRHYLLATMLIGHTLYSHAFAQSDDFSIRTSADVQYCGGQVSNSHVRPEDLADNGSVWRVGNKRWNQKYEEMYGVWVEKNIDANFFKRYEIVTDCADAALSARAIFARIHHLPVMFVGGTYSNFQKKFGIYPTVRIWNEQNWKESLKNDKRFRRALKEWNQGFGTVNIHADTYQVRIRSEADTTKLDYSSVRPGTILLSSGHTRFISSMDSLNWNPIQKLSSTVPAQVRVLSGGDFDLHNFPNIESTVEKPDRGIVSWNWIANCNGKFQQYRDDKMPNYSSEQDRLHRIYANISFKDLVQKLARADVLKNPQKEHFENMIKNVAKMVEDRIDIVEQGHAASLINPAAIRDVQGHLYDTYSTPSRDKGILKYYEEILLITNQFGEKVGVSELDISYELLNTPISYKQGKQISMYHFLIALANNGVSSEPWDSLEKRWGVSFIKGDRVKKFNVQEKTIRSELKRYDAVLADLESSIRFEKDEVIRNQTKAKGMDKYIITSWFSFIYKDRAENHKNNHVRKVEQLKILRVERKSVQKKLDFILKEAEILGSLR